MTILIKGMKMPENCYQCRFYNSPCAQCRIIGRTYMNMSNQPSIRPEWCPVVEVPTPHGRLIDADELKERIAATYYSQEEKDQAPRDDIPWMNGCNTKVKEVCGMTDDAPTVIEAEEANND